MALFTIIRIFIVAILFNLMLPSGDVYSDLALLVETVKFRNSDSYEMLGCRACYGKEESDLDKINNDSCVPCILKDYYGACASYTSSFKKMIELESEHYCDHQLWRLIWNGYRNYSFVQDSECGWRDSCCIATKKNTPYNSNEKCGVSVCQLHLNMISGRIGARRSINSLQDWKTKIDYFGVIDKVGGKRCWLFPLYGYLTLIPVTLNFLFTLFVYVKDLKDKKTTLFEIPFLIFLVYPQYKCLKTLIRYFKHRSEKKLTKELEENEDVNLLEPFCESAIQVSIYLISSFIC